MPSPSDTIAALATPVGTAALAIVRISGAETLRIVGEIAGRTPHPRSATHLDYRDKAGMLVDDVLLTFFVGPSSYTGEDAAEVSCHGNPYIAQRILEDLLLRGCRPAGPGEFTQRAFLNGRLDLSQAEAVMDVINARSERALAAAQNQLRGSLGRRMEELINALLDVVVRIEAYIDFPDEDLPLEDRESVLFKLACLTEETERLLATTHYGELLRDGIKTVIIGEPNVGKSSLLNRLVGRERALVSAEAGTTRDYIEERIIVGPHCLRVIDTAGLNPAPTPLERRGMDYTLERFADGDIILLVLDASQAAPAIPQALKNELRNERTVIVFNKNDLCNSKSPSDNGLSGISHAFISAKTGDGIANLTRLVVEKADAIQSTSGDGGIAISARHAHALKEARHGLSEAREKLTMGQPAELVASELRRVQSAFGEISGRIDNERVLDHLFARFCIGK